MLENMDKIILTTREELKEIILEVLQEHFPREEKAEPSDTLSIEEALEFLKDNGYSTSKATIYKFTSQNSIPYGRYGKRLVFSRKSLLKWAKDQVIDMSENNEGILAVIKSANRKK